MLLKAFLINIFKNYKVSSKSKIRKGAKIGKSCYIGHAYVSNKAIIGDYSYINGGILGKVTIGKYCSIGYNVNIAPAEHDYNTPSTYTRGLFPEKETERTFIGNDVWIGSGTFIKAGIKIGNGAVIGANSVVTKDIEPYAIYFGNPARLYKYRFSSEIIKELEKSEWWNLKIEILKNIIEKLENIYDIHEFLRLVNQHKTKIKK